jgi:hypothetical protein
MNVTGTEYLKAVLLELQDVAALIKLAIQEGEPRISDQRVLERMAKDIALQIRILNARLKSDEQQR